jgi:hypothetical protein
MLFFSETVNERHALITIFFALQQQQVEKK